MALPTTPHHFLLLLSLSIIIHLTVSTATPPHHYRISRHPSFHGFARRYIDECLSNIECPPYRYCTFNSTGSNAECAFTSCDAMPRRCVPRLTLDKTCQIGAGDCSNGLYCAFDVFGTSIEPACARKIPKGGACDTSATEPCVGDLVCDNKDKVCAVKKGFQGDKCQNDRDCRQDEGIYCKFVQFPQGPQDFEGTCAKKKGEGEVCGKSADNFECLDGFCLQVFGDTSVGGICLKRRSVGQVCSDDIQCRKVVLKGPRDPPILCNGIRSSGGGNVKGICIPETMLIRKPGAWCNPKMDRCDARRSLQCGRFRWRSVCLQRSQFGQFCTRGSRFSTCLTESIGAPLECRRQLALTSKAPYKSDVCSRVREVVKRGEICNREEHAICEEGSACVAGPGIQGEADKFAPPPLAYCMKSVPVGSDCRRKYDTVCASGSFCIGNKCTAASTPPVVPVTLSGISVDCSSRPCAPGLVCVTSNGNKQCDVPTVNAGLGESCFDTATKKKKCKNGLTCARRLEANGLVIKRCRPPMDIDGFCEDDTGCKGSLKCSPGDGTLKGSKCYDPAKILPKGAKCDPRAKGNQPKCVVAKNGWQPLKCLPKGNAHACQVEATLLQFCSDKDNIGCASGLKCNDKSFCVPRKERF